jgi:DNA-binding NtrC family response regulator
LQVIEKVWGVLSGKKEEAMSDEMEGRISGGHESVRTEGASTTVATILVIDDDTAVGILLCETLELRGYQTVRAETVRAAEAVLQRLGAARIGLVVTDINLTQGSHAQEGYDLYLRWTASHPTLPFLLMSGDPSSQNLPAVRRGVVHLLPKPFSINTFLDAVRALCRP